MPTPTLVCNSRVSRKVEWYVLTRRQRVFDTQENKSY